MSIFNEAPEILEVTLRDGSYLIDFQFTAQDTVVISSALESVGFRWIEIGHGLGLNASSKGKGVAAATDEEYLAAAAEAIKSARWGMFFIPDIGRLDDLRLAAKHKMSFVRIGSDITNLKSIEQYIGLAKELGLIVTYNAMKSYVVTPAEFGRCAAQAQNWGADIVYLVDSVGGMYPDEISKYLKAAQLECDVSLGFHGHDNLSLAMANTIRALECGVVLVDSSLQGMGRSAGNAITEVLVAIMKQRSFLEHIDLNTVMDIGYSLIQPLMHHRGMDPMAITSGYARFHSSFTPKVVSFAKKYNIDVRDLIVKLCQIDQVTAPDALLDKLSSELVTEKFHQVFTIPAARCTNLKQMNSFKALDMLVSDIRPLAVKSNKFSTLNIVISDQKQDEFYVSGNIQKTVSHIVGSVSLSTDEQLISVLKRIDGLVDVIFMDVDIKPVGPKLPVKTAQEILKQTLLLTYRDSRIWIDAIENQIVRIFDEVLNDKPIVIVGNHPNTRILSLCLAERGAKVSVIRSSNEKSPVLGEESIDYFSGNARIKNISQIKHNSEDAISRLKQAQLTVVWSGNKQMFGINEVRVLTPGSYLMVAAVGSILPGALEEASSRGVLLLRVNIWPVLAGALIASHESFLVHQKSFGCGNMAGIPVVAGGAIGKKGDVIIDNISEPTRVIGIADGSGGIIFDYGKDDEVRVNRVSKVIMSRLLKPNLIEA
ncbi:hypothetical protein ACFL27_07360 [candidate division CSSED10-310 bacterium]|uniref:Pyruvate carboxyltransferase domain-containing protein n=1 Tax=candidate division CSSED10-310 bacterium TaxID=2855610 RepID=A0ABV6YV69_UNCC1